MDVNSSEAELDSSKPCWPDFEWAGFCQAAGSSVGQALFTAPVLSLFIGVIIGLAYPIRDALFDQHGSLKLFGDVMSITGQPAVPASNIVMAGSIFHGIAAAVEAFGWMEWWQSLLGQCPCFSGQCCRVQPPQVEERVQHSEGTEMQSMQRLPNRFQTQIDEESGSRFRTGRNTETDASAFELDAEVEQP